MPGKVVDKYRGRYCRNGKATHRTELIDDTDYTIVQRYQAVLKGLYNYYCMAINVSVHMSKIRWVLTTSLLKTLALKHRCKTRKIVRRYKAADSDLWMLRVVVERPGKDPLIAVFRGFRLERKPDGMGTTDFRFNVAWSRFSGKRSEVVQRLVAGECELCGREGIVEIHHVRKLSDIDRPGRPPKNSWEKIMSARKRKTLAVCEGCHDDIHAGRYDGPKL
jgi:hypothetical protein